MLKHIPTTTTAPTTATNRTQSRTISQPLNVSTLSATSNGLHQSLLQTHPNHQHSHTKHLNNHNHHNHHPMFTPLPSISNNSSQQPLMTNIKNTTPPTTTTSTANYDHTGASEALTSLGLLCLVSLLLALLSLIFLLKISPDGRALPSPLQSQHSLLGLSSQEEYAIIFDVTLSLIALSLSLNLCCLLVCAIQFLFAVKLIRAPVVGRGNKYLQKSSVSRVVAISGFFISIPIFLTGIILYTFTQFHSTSAIISSCVIGVGIVFCGAAMVNNVFIWQKEKTNCVKERNKQQLIAIQQQQQQQQQQQSSVLNHPPIHAKSSLNTPLNLNLSMNSPISTIHTSFMNYQRDNSNIDHINNHSYVNGGLANLNSSHTSQAVPTTQLTPISANSHISFNPYISSNFALRTTTPPTPKIGNGIGNVSRQSISPSNLPNNISNNNLLELSTLV